MWCWDEFSCRRRNATRASPGGPNRTPAGEPNARGASQVWIPSCRTGGVYAWGPGQHHIPPPCLTAPMRADRTQGPSSWADSAGWRTPTSVTKRTRTGTALGSRILGVETGFRPRKIMSSFFLLKWGVRMLCLFNRNQTPRSDSVNLEPSEPIFCPQVPEQCSHLDLKTVP